MSVHVLAIDGAAVRGAPVDIRDVTRGSDWMTLAPQTASDIDRGDSVEVRIAPAADATLYSSASGVRAASDTTLTIVLLPKQWTIRHGIYQDSTVPIDLAHADDRTIGDTLFLNRFASVATMLTTWAPSAYPIPVALDTSQGRRHWTPSDSAFFWSAANRFNAIAGQSLFVPAPDASARPGAIAVQIEFDLRKIVTPTGSLAVPLGACGDRARLCTAVRGTVSLSEGTLLEFPGSYFETARERENARTVQHELMHALGFGHGCYWPSIMMYTGPACAATFPEEPSAYDIAYVELVQTLAGTLAVHPDAWHLAEARP